METCKKCGGELRPGSRYCPACGAKIEKSLGDLVSAAKNGDNEAFGQLYERTFRTEYYAALQYMRSREAAEDVLQDAYVKAFSNLEKLTDPDKFPNWLGRIVANTAKSRLRRKDPSLFTDIAPADPEEGEDPLLMLKDMDISGNPEEACLAQERQALVRELLDALTPEQRMCVVMFYLEDMSLREIATALNTNENTVKSRLFKARHSLNGKAEEMKKHGYVFTVAPLPLLIFLMRGLQKIQNAPVPPLPTAVKSALTAHSSEASTVSAGQYEVPASEKGSGPVSATTNGFNPATNAVQAGYVPAAPYGVATSGVSASASRSFFSSVAVKVIAVVAAVAVAGGGGYGIARAVHAQHAVRQNEDSIADSLEPGESGVAPGLMPDGDTGHDRIAEEPEPTMTPLLLTQEETLLRYLEEEIIPAYGIYDLEQRVYYLGAGDWGYYDHVFDPVTRELTESRRSEYGMPPSDVPGVDAEGLYAVDFFDYDRDGEPELLTVRGENGSDSMSPSTWLELYDFQNGAVSQNGRYSIEPFGPTVGGWGSAYQTVQRVEIDGESFIFLSRNPFRSDVSFKDDYWLLSVSDTIAVARTLRFEDASYDYTTQDQMIRVIERDGGGNTIEEETAGLRSLMATGSGLTPIVMERWGIAGVVDLCVISNGLANNDFFRTYYGTSEATEPQAADLTWTIEHVTLDEEYYYEYPVFSGGAADVLNAFAQGRRDHHDAAVRQALEAEENWDGEDLGAFYYVNCSVELAGGYVTIQESGSSFTNGAVHGFVESASYVFSALTGEEITLESVIGLSGDELQAFLIDRGTQWFMENYDSDEATARNLMSQAVFGTQFHILADGSVMYVITSPPEYMRVLSGQEFLVGHV